jgi:hypothetical protein
MKRAQLNLAMAGLIAVIGAGLYLSRETPEAEIPLLPLAEEAIDRIDIAHPEQAAIVLQREGDQWRLTAPVQAAADAFEVASLTRLARLPVRRELAADVDRAGLGLSPPDFVIRLNDYALAFGDTEPLSSQRYIGLEDRVVLVDNPPGSALDRDYSDLVSKQLVPPEAVITRITLPGLNLHREDGRWRSPEAPEASADQLLALAEGWRDARAMWNAQALEVDPAVNDTVRIEFEDGQEIEWIIARREPQFELIRADLKVQYTLSRALVDSLLSLPPLPEAEDTDTDTDAAE